MHGVVGAVAGGVVVVGALLVLLAAVGVVRFGDLYSRMHAATKATTLGIGLVSVAAMLTIEGGWPRVLLALGVVLVTAPGGAHVIARAAAIDLPPDGADDPEEPTAAPHR